MLSANDLTVEQQEALIEMDASGDTCMVCSRDLPLSVCQSAAGYYIGTFCEECGPYDRYSMYGKEKEVENWLRTACWPIRA